MTTIMSLWISLCIILGSGLPSVNFEVNEVKGTDKGSISFNVDCKDYNETDLYTDSIGLQDIGVTVDYEVQYEKVDKYTNSDISATISIDDKIIDMQMYTRGTDVIVTTDTLESIMGVTGAGDEKLKNDIDYAKSLGYDKVCLQGALEEYYSEYTDDSNIVTSAKELFEAIVDGYKSGVIVETANGISYSINSNNISDEMDKLGKNIIANKDKVIPKIKEIESIIHPDALGESASIDDTEMTEDIINEFKTAVVEGVKTSNLDITGNISVPSSGELQIENTISINPDETTNIKVYMKNVHTNGDNVQLASIDNYYSMDINNESKYVNIQYEKGEGHTASVEFYNGVTCELNYIIKEDRLYLPLRATCEGLGYEVKWDELEEKAYVVNKAGEEVDMTGMVVDDRTYIKVRDFEKIGLSVEYTESGINNTTCTVLIAEK